MRNPIAQDLFPPDHRSDFLLVLDALRLLQDIIADEADCKTILQDSYAALAPLFADLLLVLSHDAKAAALPSDQAQGQSRKFSWVPDNKNADQANLEQNSSR